MPVRSCLHDVGPAPGHYLVPKYHVANESIVLLHREQAAQILLREVVFSEPSQNQNMEAGIPKPLEWIALERGCNVAIMLTEQSGIALDHVLQQQAANI